jgi:hypothetical protein
MLQHRGEPRISGLHSWKLVVCAIPMLAMPPAWLRVGMVEPVGIEPTTSSLQS